MKLRHRYAIPAALAALLGLAPVASSQTTTIGTPCGGDIGQVPSLYASGEPLVGEISELYLEALPFSMGILFAGTSHTSWDGMDLPLNLDFIGLPGCRLFTNIKAQVPFVTDENGFATVPVTFTSFGQAIYLQAYTVDTTNWGFGGMTAGLGMRSYLAGGGVPGSVIVSEFMSHPSTSSAAAGQGEWVELHNTTSTPIDIEGWSLRDDGFDSGLMLGEGSGIVIPAGGYAVVGISADVETNGGIEMAVVISNYLLSNMADEIVLVDRVGNEIDRVEYSMGAGWPTNQTGSSVALDVQMMDAGANDLASSWSLSACTIVGLGSSCNPDLGTPGQANDTCSTVPCQQ